MTTHGLRSGAARRREVQEKAAALGIDEVYIDVLVEAFYARVRRDDQLGPIFASVVEDDWAPHLATMKDFWASVAMNAGRYSGKPVPKHVALTSVAPEHFDRWLGLFQETLEATAPTPGAIPYLAERAERIAASLKLAMFGVSGLPPIARAEKEA